MILEYDSSWKLCRCLSELVWTRFGKSGSVCNQSEQLELESCVEKDLVYALVSEAHTSSVSMVETVPHTRRTDRVLRWMNTTLDTGRENAVYRR